jgi:5-formyltetrahydrofolate cyclo-ligase
MYVHEFRLEIMPESTSNKAALRRALLADRQAISAEVRGTWDAVIGARVVAWWEAHGVETLGVFWPIRGEPDLRAAYAALSARGVRLALPVVVDRNAALGFVEWKPGDAMKKDESGVPVPAAGAEVQPQALLIPCVGFNEERFRLGYGGGFYDRTLATMPRPLAIGIGYECARANFDAHPHDIALDAIITEKP